MKIIINKGQALERVIYTLNMLQASAENYSVEQMARMIVNDLEAEANKR